jgi:hypothetical protein
MPEEDSWRKRPLYNYTFNYLIPLPGAFKNTSPGSAKLRKLFNNKGLQGGVSSHYFQEFLIFHLK